MLLQTFADFESQIESRKIRIRVFEQLDYTQALPVMLESAVITHALGQYFFAGMSKRRVAKIMRERNRFREIFVKRERSSDRATDRRDFN